MQPQPDLWQDRRVTVVSLVVLVLLAAFLLVQTVNSIKEFRFIGGGVPVTNVITVQGEGEVFAVPDIATFTFSVIEEGSDASAAQNAAAEKTNGILSFIKEQGVEDKDIRTTNFNLFPRYEFQREASSSEFFPPSGERVLVGFEVKQSISVKVRDTKEAGRLIAGVSELGASSVSSLNFTIDDEEALMEEARSAAIEDARDKAKQLARDLDVSLVRVVSFSEFGGGGFRGLDFAVATESIAFDDGGGAIAPALPTGENRIVSNVSVTYEIR